MNRSLTVNDIIMLLSASRSSFPPVEKSISLEVEFLSSSHKFSLPPDIKAIYQHIFNHNSQTINLFNVVPFEEKKTKMPICYKQIKSASHPRHEHYGFRCYDCQLNSDSVFCPTCFNAGDHESHRFEKINSNGGNCDCGNKTAFKPEGFCKEHSGEPQDIQIPSSTQERFNYFFKEMFQWFFQLAKLNQKGRNFKRYSYTLFKHLSHLNEESLYYNILTYNLMLENFSNSQTLLYSLLRIEQPSSISSICGLFYKMFSCVDFKQILMVEFTEAYNSIAYFETRQFDNLFPQLVADSNLVRDICQKYKKVPNANARPFNLKHILSQWNSIIGLSKQTTIIYCECYFAKPTIISIPFMDKVQENIETKHEKIHENLQHKIEQENYYYIVIEELMKKCSSSELIIRNMVVGFYSQMKKYSYKQNKILLPFHRCFALCLYTYYNGNIEDITIESLKKLFSVEEDEILGFFKRNVKIVLKCILQFSETFAKNSYFDQYNTIYLRSGCTIYKFDYMFVRISACVFSCYNHVQFHQIIGQLWNEATQQELSNEEFIKKWINFLGILIEITASNYLEIHLYNLFQLSNNRLKKQCLGQIKRIFKLFCPFEPKHFKSLQRYFFGGMIPELIEECVTYDKKSMKYILNEGIEEKPLNFNYFNSLHKIREMFPIRYLPEDEGYPPQLIQKNQKILNSLCLDEIITKIVLAIKKQQISVDANDLMIRQLKKLSELTSQTKGGNSNEKKMIEDLSLQVKKIQQKQIKNNEKKLQKLKRMKSKRESFLQKNNQEVKEDASQTNVECMICKEEKENEPICYLTHIFLSNSMKYRMGEKRFQCFFSTCSHTVHYKCCQNSQLHECPLCQKKYNLMIPIPSSHFNQVVLQEIITKIASIAPIRFLFNMFNLEVMNKITVFVSVLYSFTEMMGYFAIKEPKSYENKEKYLVHALYLLLKRIWLDIPQDLIEKEVKTFLDQCLVPCQPNKQVIRCIEHCIVMNIFKSFFNPEEFAASKIFQFYYKKINRKDLHQIVNNILRCVNPSQTTEVESKEEQFYVASITSIINNFFQPPKTAKQLLKIRIKSKQPCSNNHTTGYCVLCKKDFCVECSTLHTHAISIHAGECVFFSPIFGNLIYAHNGQHFPICPLYQNRIGEVWTPRKSVDGFYLDLDEYLRICDMLLTHSLYEWLHANNKIVEGGGDFFFIIEDFD